MTTDPLSGLVVRGDQLDRELLSSALDGLVQLVEETAEIRLTGKAVKMSKKHQILVYLLGRKAARAIGLIEEEAAPPSVIEPALGIDGGPLRGQLFKLKKDRLVRSEAGRYLIPSYGIEAVKEILMGTSGGE